MRLKITYYKTMKRLIYVFILLVSTQASAQSLDAIIEELENYTDVFVNDARCDDYKHLDALYFPDTNEIILCSDRIENGWPEHKIENAKKQSILHEAVHLAQDCVAGKSNTILTVLDGSRTVKAHILEKIKTGYLKEDQEIEIEAWSYWNKPGALDLVRKHCK